MAVATLEEVASERFHMPLLPQETGTGALHWHSFIALTEYRTESYAESLLQAFENRLHYVTITLKALVD